MKVSSPVGEFPFEPTRIRIERGGIVVEGSMGAWPATVRVGPADLPRLVQVIPWRVWVGLIVFTLVTRRLVDRS